MNYLILKLDEKAPLISCLTCCQQGIYKKYLKIFSGIFKYSRTGSLCPVDIINKYLSVSGRKTIFYKKNNSIYATSKLDFCISKYSLNTLIYKLKI